MAETDPRAGEAAISVADVVVMSRGPDFPHALTYSVPQRLAGAVNGGACVHVPLNQEDAVGYVVGLRRLAPGDPIAPRLRPVHAVIEDAVPLTDEQLGLATWLSTECVCTMSQAIRCIVPASMGARVDRFAQLLAGAQRAENLPAMQRQMLDLVGRAGGELPWPALRARFGTAAAAAFAALQHSGRLVDVRRIRARSRPRTAMAYALTPVAPEPGAVRLGARQAAVLDALRELDGPAATVADLDAVIGAGAAGAVRSMAARGWLEVRTVGQARRPSVRARNPAAVSLTPGQRAAVTAIDAAIAAGEPRAVVVHGVTASGKTEVYLRALQRCLDAGRTAIVLVPEIALTSQLVELFIGRFGSLVAVLHSQLGDGERYDEWRRLHRGEARIVVGPRSAVFAPVARPALIVIDEEHEGSYKQDRMPRYDARPAAFARARATGATVVLGSATPSVETYFAATRAPADRRLFGVPAELVTMPERANAQPLPSVEVVDMRDAFRSHKAIFSPQLEAALRAAVAAGRQSLLFLNRRGFAQFVLCRACGHVPQCRNCSISLTFHHGARLLRCHHCDFQQRVPDKCPECGESPMRGFGMGTERVQTEVEALIPGVRIVRMDRDTTSGKDAHARLLARFRDRKADMLIGTQMIAKGLDFPGVTLVGVVAADTALFMPDFRASERAFQLVSQVAGRSGRGVDAGAVIVQTFCPDHPAIAYAAKHEYLPFFQHELELRREAGYPPFARIANLMCASGAQADSEAFAETLADRLRRADGGWSVLGPAPARIARLRGAYRTQVMVRAAPEFALPEEIGAALEGVHPPAGVALAVDIDPVSGA